MTNTTSNASTMSAATASPTMILGVSTNPTYIQNCSEPQKPEVNFTGIDFWVFECVWLVFCCTGIWSTKQPLRIIALCIGFFKVLMEMVMLQRRRITLSWFLIYLVGRIDIETNRTGGIKSVALLFWMLLDVAVDLIGDNLNLGYLLEGVSMALFLVYQLTWVILRYGRPGRCQLGWVVNGILWVMGWVALAVTCFVGAEASVTMAGWLMLYPIFYPRVKARLVGRTPPPQRRGGWLDLISSREDAGCSGCGATLRAAGCLWNLGIRMQCSRCYMEDPHPHAVHGVLQGTITTQVPVDMAMELEEQARIIWSSYWNRGATWIPRVVTGGYYVPTYTRIWEFRDRSRIRTTHALDGRLLIAGARHAPTPYQVEPLTPLSPESQASGEPRREHRDMETQTAIAGVVTEEGDGGEDANLEEMAEAVEYQLRGPSPAPEPSNDQVEEAPTLSTLLARLNALEWPQEATPAQQPQDQQSVMETAREAYVPDVLELYSNASWDEDDQ